MNNYAGKINGVDVYTDENMIKKEGYEYKRVPRFDIPFLRWIKKTIKVDRMIPMESVVYLKDSNTFVAHPDIVSALFADNLNKNNKG